MHRVFHRAAWLAARPYLIVFAISSLIVSRWFRTGTFIAGGDMGPFIRQGWEPEAMWAWNHQTTGAGSAGYTMARGFEFVVIWVCKTVGLTEYSAQWLFYTIIYGLVGFGIAYLAGAFVRSEAGIVIAGVFGVLNGFFMTRLPNPLNIISVGVVALITGIAMRVAMGRRVPTPIAGFALMPTSFLSFNPPMLVVAYAWAIGGTPLLALLVLGRKPALRLVKWFVAAAPWAIVLNVYWLYPLAMSFVGGGGAAANATFQDPTNWSWSQVNNTPPNILTMVANWAWFRPQYLPYAADLDRPAWIWIRYLLPFVVFLAPLLAPRRLRRLAFGLLLLILIFVFLAKGLRPPLNQFNMFLYLHAPGFWLFREPMSKLGQLLVSFFGIMLAISMEGLLTRLRASKRFRPGWPRRLVTAVAVLPFIGVVAYPYPIYTGQVMPDERPTQPSAHVRVLQDWWDVADKINADPRPGKVLILPLDDYYQMPTTWGFFGADSVANLLLKRPVVAPKPGGYFGETPGFNASVHGIENTLLAGDLAPVPKLLEAIGASKVIVRHDLVRGLPNRYFADDRILGAAMAKVQGGELVHDGTLQVWNFNGGTSPTLRTFDRVLDAPARADAGAAVLGTVDSRTGIAARVDTSPVNFNPYVDDTAVVTPDVVHWPVPAVDSGSPTTTVSVTAGTYTLAQRARAAAVLVPRIDVAGNRLVLEDPAVLKIDGKAVSQRPAMAIPLPRGRKIVALKVGTRTVSLDNGVRTTVPVGSATSVTLLATAAKPADTTGYSPVFDCNNYEPRPWSQLQLTATIKRGTVRLSAADHAACTKVVARNTVPGQHLRVRLQYRHVTGARPQICLWQAGVSGCELAARPVLNDGWTSYERVVTMDSLSRELQVILRADVGERLKPKTVAEYRGLRIDALESAATHTVFPPAIPETSVKLTAGKHQLRVDGGLSGSILAPFEPLDDCFRYDDETVEQAGLEAEEQLGSDGDTTYTLKAVRHLACIGALAEDMGAASLYEYAMEARSVALRNPKYCMYLRGPDLCRTMPGVAIWNGWTSYETLVEPDPNAVETRIYLYGLRDPKGQQQSQVEYRGVRLRPVNPSEVVLVRQEAPAVTSSVDYKKVNPTQFTGTVTSSGKAAVALAENAAPGWVMTGAQGAQKVTLQGWMNGWLLPEGGEVAVRYTPARLARYALYLLPTGVVASLIFMYVVRLPEGRPGSWTLRHRQPGRLGQLWARRPRLRRLLFRRRT
ncbi:hypothetical protein [Actinoplanes sp. NPDC051859]|uniref:hypothetical protein n=1 Tax=Actinoplanes sp. NPDC051859 TaxID=3363909 RepID=UPI0037A3DF6D